MCVTSTAKRRRKQARQDKKSRRVAKRTRGPLDLRRKK